MFKQRPHTAVLTYTTDGTYSTLREYTAGTAITKPISCDIQPSNSGRYVVGASGDSILLKWQIFANRYDGDTSIPQEGVSINFFDKDYPVTLFYKYQKHLEILI